MIVCDSTFVLAFLCLVIEYEQTFFATNHQLQQTTCEIAHIHLSVLHASYMYFLQVLIGSHGLSASFVIDCSHYFLIFFINFFVILKLSSVMKCISSTIFRDRTILLKCIV